MNGLNGIVKLLPHQYPKLDYMKLSQVYCDSTQHKFTSQMMGMISNAMVQRDGLC